MSAMKRPQPVKRLTSSNENKAATRTTVSTTVLTAILMISNKVFKWELTLEDLTPWIPAIAVAYGFALRLMYALGDRFPFQERVFFGIAEQVSYETHTPPPPPPGATLPPPDPADID
jgi:hypothetical protein